MLHLVTGTPGAKKTAFVVTQLDKIESQNKVNLERNRKTFLANHSIIQEKRFEDDFSYLTVERGTGHTLTREVQILEPDYFQMFDSDFDELRPDDYFKRVTEYNAILERINEREGEQGFLGLLPVRTIYTNINNLKIDYVRANIYDWRECPDGSIIVIDEVQLVEPYDNQKDKSNPIVQELTIHRHRGFDFYFITQATSLLHPTVKELIGLHYHMTVPFGWRTRVYQFGSARANPNAMTNKINCERKFDFNPPDRIFKLYKSTTINTHKKRFPIKGFVILLLFIIACLFVIASQVSGMQKSSLINDKAVSQSVAEAKGIASGVAPTEQSTSAVATTPNPFLQGSAVAQTQPPQAVSHQGANAVYNVIAFGDKCTAYGLNGNPLGLPFSECIKYINGEKSLHLKSDMAVANVGTAPSLSNGNVASNVGNEDVSTNHEVLPD